MQNSKNPLSTVLPMFFLIFAYSKPYCFQAAEAGFVMVPPSLAGDSSNKHRGTQGLGVSPLTARRIGARPGSLPGVSRAHSTEPIPVC